MRRLLIPLVPLIGIFSLGNLDSCQGSNSSLNVNIEDGCYKAYSLCLTEVKSGTNDVGCHEQLNSTGAQVLDATGHPKLICSPPDDACRDQLNACYDMYTAWSHASFTNNSCQDDDTIAGNGCLVPEKQDCGNGKLDAGEVCDSTAAAPGNKCPSGKVCEGCSCVSLCLDGIKEASEDCDPTAKFPCNTCPNNQVCTQTCQCGIPQPSCGNGIKEAGEECDDGNAINDDGCTNTCKLPKCGDGIIQSGEGCDDGNTINGDGCNNLCKREFCGDNHINQLPGVEACDGTDCGACPGKCTANCQCPPPPKCGNNQKDAGEQCDGTADAACHGKCKADCTCPAVGGEGCTPGYWKNNDKAADGTWIGTPYHTYDDVNAVFGLTQAADFTCWDHFGGMNIADLVTLLDALCQGGGALDALGRHMVAGLLNAAHPSVSYGIEPASAVIGLVKNLCDSIGSGTEAAKKTAINNLKDQFDSLNNAGCPLKGDPGADCPK